MLSIKSEFADDEDWQEILTEFVEVIPARINRLIDTLQRGDAEELKVLVHQLRGACGSYGFHDITPIASELETALRNDLDAAKHEAKVLEFIANLRRITAEA